MGIYCRETIRAGAGLVQSIQHRHAPVLPAAQIDVKAVRETGVEIHEIRK
ncbi:hypothetical protein [Luteolibacter luteus]|uniref:Uncharacterized protein n=1 Tax=Luteolibacter luteus TaxID=2728835 RepID=A0A858RKF1_9BACT|nr:hypothetical protein [Luteolibacter luteus]QJE96938.1 hypothetical protein HHL09_14460 [Luteolibacter luteus]